MLSSNDRTSTLNNKCEHREGEDVATKLGQDQGFFLSR